MSYDLRCGNEKCCEAGKSTYNFTTLDIMGQYPLWAQQFFRVHLCKQRHFDASLVSNMVRSTSNGDQ